MQVNYGNSLWHGCSQMRIRVGFARTTLTLATLLSSLATESRAQEVKFRITAGWTVHETSPRTTSRQANFVYLVSLRGRTVRELLEREVGESGSTTFEQEGKLGVSGDEISPTQWKVINSSTLVRLQAWKSHTFAIWLRTQGPTSCTASLEWRLKPGFTAYESWAPRRRTMIHSTEPSWPTAKCEVL
ncbi:hypothetical protein [Bosea sp. 124]|uniref:hypothetical protein n=1 Tax=Bosea sp. 124 TaxID=2135642 RepID=UPI0011B1FFA5|nr:hypothetical protein [Bosea sp. 124]